ncbi:conserved hypothetical protein [Alkaliphilus metalliredigens QYMF]|uniref:Uncharacterized protein n=1 Tax=Alkaliphilus metalliredigens (strain QYMF) TaxID=293826 RepID=A6TMZ4_ALKMQ|nr:hypothetical protein [Alkaliphilus metalliredigens]ABR47562.1 conserved hypothetical protein [Alkaliphilus metalliredigens QYMF]
MSAFLGPIHHWLFNKIVLFEELETTTVNHLTSIYGDDAKQIGEAAEAHFGTYLPKLPLENLIDTNNIHGWLQNRIQIAETRQAATLKNMIERYGNEVVNHIQPLYISQGKSTGLGVAQGDLPLNAPALHKELNNYLLDGMPCDNVNSLTITEAEHLEWQTTRCLHRPYWDQVGMDSSIMYQLRFSWINAFIENANPNYTYEAQLLEGQDGYLQKIYKK